MRLLSHLSLLLVCALLPQAGASQLLGNTLRGDDSLDLRTKGDFAAKDLGRRNAVLDVAANGDYSYVSEGGLSFVGVIDDTGEKPSMDVDVASLEASIETLLEFADDTVDVTSITIKDGSLKAKLTEKEVRGFVDVRIKVRATFSGTSTDGDFTGKLKLVANVTDEPACTVCGKTFTGIETGRRELGNCDTEQIEGPITFEIGLDDEAGRPFDGNAPLLLTNSLGDTLMGQIVQDGLDLECSLNQMGREKSEDKIEGDLLGTCTFTLGFVAVGVSDIVCRGQVSDDGNAIELRRLNAPLSAADHFKIVRGRNRTSGDLEAAP